jgi:hypothetical protein
MANWKKVIVSGSIPSFTDIKVDGLASNTVVLGGGSGSVLTTQARNGTGNIVGTTAADGVSMSGSFSGSFQGTINADIASASIADTAGTASVALRANSLAPTVTATSASVAARATTLSPAATASFADSATTASYTSATASFADLASDARTATSASIATSAGTASVAVRANALSPLATASIADFATSASHAATGDGIFSGSFSGSFEGNGAGLTGIATTLTVDADSGGTSTVDLKTQTFDIAGTANEIETSVSGQTVTIGLPNNVTVGQDLTVTRDAVITRNLTVQGTASFQATTDLDVADRFIRLASGSNAAGEGGFVVQQGDNGLGEVFGYDQSTLRFGVSSSFDATQNSFTPDAFFSNVIEGAGDDPTATIAKYTKKGNTFVASNGDLYIYS